MTTLLQLQHVTFRYPQVSDAAALPVLHEADLTVQRGESVAIIGPSGAGKSTLLNLIGTLERPTAGRIMLDGVDLGTLDEAERARLRNEKIGFIFQDHHLLPQCTVLENVLVPTLVNRAPGRGGKNAMDRAKRLLDRVGLADRLDHRPGQLSGGQRQRVAVVRALINEPALLLADEPTGSLDRAAAQNMADLLVDLNREEGVTLIVVTHALDLAARLGRVMELRDGKFEPYSPTVDVTTAANAPGKPGG